MREELDPEVCASIYTNIFNSIFQPEFMNDNNLSLDNTIAHTQIIISNGFFNKAAIKKIDKYRNTKVAEFIATSK